ncbi:MAG: AAA family ATPase [Proteobacteria bacterium]|nr:AAA family ATPase [Pseudomonadota bacterium]
MLVVAVTNQKGGVGKTTTAINLASGLAIRGKKTLLVDIDPQGNATSGLGIDNRILKKTVYNVLLNPMEINDALLKTNIENLFILPSNSELVGAEIELITMERREFRLKSALGYLSGFDFIIIDCPPSLGILTLNAIVASKGLLVPMQSEYYSLEGLSRLLKTIKMVKKELNPSLDIMGILLTMFDGRNNLAKCVFEEIKKHFGDKLFSTLIPRNVKLSEAPSHGQPIFTFEPSSRGSLSYQLFVEEFLERSKQYE